MTEKTKLFSKSKINLDFANASKVVYGFPKSGKTTLAAFNSTTDGREPLFIPTEDGHGALSVYKTEKIKDWVQFKGLIARTLKPNWESLRKEHSCIVLDLATDLCNKCENYISKEKHNVDFIGDVGAYGKGWVELTDEFTREIDVLLGILPVIFICHAKEKELMWNGEKVKLQTPDLSKGVLNYINGKVDAIIWVNAAPVGDVVASISLQNTTDHIGGCRYPWMVKVFPFYTQDVKKTYQIMQQTFTKKEALSGNKAK